MGKRSLVASASGIKRARLALERQNLTQMMLVSDRLIASWATVNKFFNGHPIDRPIFIDICQALNLDWQEIAASPSLEPANTGTVDEITSNTGEEKPIILSAVQQCAAAAREALTPRILQRISRNVVREKYLRAIERGTQGTKRVIPIIGPAGYGKSTILGDIYDELISSNARQNSTAISTASLASPSVSAPSNWVALILCSTLANNLTPSIENLAIALGDAAAGTQTSIIEIAAQLTKHRGRGVILIDTLDLVIDRAFASAFGNLLRQLLAEGVTIVFTCRDHEYGDFLEPVRTKLAGISESVDRYFIPEFTSGEIRKAAEVFCNQIESDTPNSGRDFADKILALSADNRSLRTIISNPLLLALLCDLFAKDGNVPPDLTVSKLYKQYWQEKIAYSRIDDSQSSLLAIEKNNLCLTIAKAFFDLSETKLCESAYLDELGISFTEIVAAAYNDLLSEGVLERLPSTKIHFFHQTLLEYAIAYWLTRKHAIQQRNQLLSLLQAENGCHSRIYWWPVIRQHLTIVETDEEFEEIVQQLDTSDVAAFGAIAFAAASRDRPGALLKLLPTALELGEAYQKRLRVALESAPRQLAREVWEAMLVLLERGKNSTAVNTAKTVGALLARWWTALGSRLDEALQAINKRPVIAGREKQSLQDRSQILGWLIQPCFPVIKQSADLDALRTLTKHYHSFGYRTCSQVIQLHLTDEIPLTVQLELLETLQLEPVPLATELEENLVTFVGVLLPELVKLSRGSEAKAWMEFLHRSYPQRWDTIQAQAIGRRAAAERAIIKALLGEMLSGDEKLMRRNLAALREAIRCGGQEWLVSDLTANDVRNLAPKRLTFVGGLLKNTVRAFAPAEKELLAKWLSPIARMHPEKLIETFEGMAEDSPTARQIFVALIEQFPPSQKKKWQVNLLRFEPIETHPPLEELDKKSQLILVKFYQKIACNCPQATAKLLKAVGATSKDVALAASAALNGEICSLNLSQLLPLLESKIPGVRVNGLSAIAHLSSGGLELTDEQLTAIATRLQDEDNQAVIRPLCEMVAAWVQKNKRVQPLVASAVGEALPRLVALGLFEGGTARVLIAALKAIARVEDPTLTAQMGKWTRTLLGAIDLIRVINSESEIIDLLGALNRSDQQLLEELIKSDGAQLPPRNLRAVVLAIRCVEGATSPLFDYLLNQSWCLPEIRSLILEGLRA